MTLLHLLAAGELPSRGDLSIRQDHSVEASIRGDLTGQKYDVVITNPPYIKLDHLSPGERDVYQRYLGPTYSGRIDAYIPFVELCLSLAVPDGIVCLVLPQTFLTAANTRSLREKISTEFDVRCLVDLSAVQVFSQLVSILFC